MASTSFTYIVESFDLWHARLGHTNIDSIKRLKDLNLITKLSNMNFYKCEVCIETKFHKKPFKSIERQTELLKLIHSDLGDFKNHMTRGSKRYYIIFVNDYSNYTMVYPLNSKYEAKQMFIKYKAIVENQLDSKIKRLRSDKGGEYDCETNGFIHEWTASYTPEQNGVAENGPLKNMMNAMLISFEYVGGDNFIRMSCIKLYAS